MKVVTVARKPFAGSVTQNVLTHGAGALNIDGCRIATADGKPHYHYPKGAKGWGFHGGVGDREVDGSRDGEAISADAGGRWPSNVILQHTTCTVVGERNWQCAEGCPVDELGAQSGMLRARGNIGSSKGGGGMYGHGLTTNDFGAGDAGTAARFFKQVKP